MSQKRSSRYLITQSLLSSWQYVFKSEDGYEDFLKTLRKEPKQQTMAMLEGNRFESVLNSVLNGVPIDETHEWYKPIMELYPILQGAQQQVAVSKDVVIDGVSFVLYGKLDFLKSGIIFDTKYSKTYEVGKYLDSPQHPMYLELVTEAREFQYLICDGTYIYTETYRPGELEPIEQIIKYFMKFLDRMNLVKTFCDNWKSQY